MRISSPWRRLFTTPPWSRSRRRPGWPNSSSTRSHGIFVLHGGDLTLQANYEIHQKLVDEIHWTVGTWDITPLSDDPERARAQGIVYWQGRPVDSADGALLKCYVGEDWVVERVPSGELKFVIYVNSFHRFLPDAAPIEIR
jgi:hypothetical protein